MIFISHDDRDGELAEAWSKLLSSVSAGVLKSFRSSDRKGTQGMEFGVEWYPELMRKLDAASDVVCLLTPRSLDRPWILYEAGVAKGKLDVPVFGVAFGMPLNKASSGPFAQFQNCDDSEDALTKLVMQLLQRIPGAAPDQDAVRMQVGSFKSQVEKLLPKLTDAHKESSSSAAVDETSVLKLFEEVKIMFQDLPSRVESRLGAGPDSLGPRKTRRLHPMMFVEFGEMMGRPGDPVTLLLLSSMFRDDYPALYELGMEGYLQLRSGNTSKAMESIDTLVRLAEYMARGPFAEDFGYSSKDSHIILMELPRLLQHITMRFKRERKPRSKSANEEALP